VKVADQDIQHPGESVALSVTAVTFSNIAHPVKLEINVKMAHLDVQYPGESVALSVTAVTFPNIANTRDCMRDNLRGQENEVLKLSLGINSDGTLTFHSDGYPGIKLTQKSIAALAAPSGKYESSVPFVMTSPPTSRVQLPATSKSTRRWHIRTSSTQVNPWHSVTPGESMAPSDTAVSIYIYVYMYIRVNTGDYMGDNLRGYKQGVSKYSLHINSEGTLTFYSDGQPDMRLTQKSIATLAAPSEEYENSVPFIIGITADFKKAAACDSEIYV
jgi:hypothetical protein